MLEAVVSGKYTQPELAARPDAAAEAIIQQGQEVGMLARTLFPGGVEVIARVDSMMRSAQLAS